VSTAEIAWVELLAGAVCPVSPSVWAIPIGPGQGGGPMDLSYLTAVLNRLPPYDPWLAGRMINYYYYG
jgi:uncharacterized membrane protein